MLLEQFPFRAFEQHLFRREIAQQLVHIVEISSAVKNSPVDISRKATPTLLPFPK